MTGTAIDGSRSGVRARLPAAAVVAGITVIVPVALLIGVNQMVLFGVIALVVGLSALRSPVFATVVLLVAIFLRLPSLRQGIELPVELWVITLALLVLATVMWMDRTPMRVRGIGPIECAMAVYLLWNLYSMVAPHRYPAIDPLLGEPISVARFILIGTVLPFALYLVGRYVFDRPSAVGALLWSILGFAAYSAAVSIMQFTGPTDLVWPGYIV